MFLKMCKPIINANQHKRKQIIIANHHQCKPTPMQPTINANQHQCKPIINANQHQCKPTSMQPNIDANQHQCKATSLQTAINANQSSMQTSIKATHINANQSRKPPMSEPSSSTSCVYAQMLLFTRFSELQGGGNLSSNPADPSHRQW